jgi:hypothetical protein
MFQLLDLLQTARLFGPAIFEASKLSVLFLGSNKEHPDRLPRIYTLPSISFTVTKSSLFSDDSGFPDVTFEY